MSDNNADAVVSTPKRIPWNKGKLTGTKPALQQKHVWAIRSTLQIERRVENWRCSILLLTASCAAVM
jgi:hypothetical protein